MNPLIPLAAIAGASLYGASGRRAKASDPSVTAGELQFYRGGEGPLRAGPAYFTSGAWLAKFYGSVKKHRLYLHNPKFVTQDEWGGFDATMLRSDPTPAQRLRAAGYDSAVWINQTPQGVLYTVYALDGVEATKKTPSVAAALATAEDEWDAAYRLKALRRIAKRLNLDVKGLTAYRHARYTEVFVPDGRNWTSRMGRPISATDAKADYIAELIREKIGNV
tara:strand:+ start:1751 stop:2413 length:663 start_codon:yes stop_codon:yes gene_type:complete